MSGVTQRSFAAFVLIALGGCGGDATPPSTVGNSRFDAIAEAFRHEGALYGAQALDRRFERDGVSVSDALSVPDDLPRFLAASRPIVTCGAALPAVVYVGPVYRAALVTRWSAGDPIRLVSVHALEPPARNGEPAPEPWFEALLKAESVTEALQSREARAAESARDETLCDATRERAQAPGPLIAADERDDRDTRPRDGASFELAVSLERAVRRAFLYGDTGQLEPLGLGAFAETFTQLAAAQPAVLPVPVGRRAHARADSALALLLYADLNVSGRWLMMASAVPLDAGDGRRAQGRVALVALP